MSTPEFGGLLFLGCTLVCLVAYRQLIEKPFLRSSGRAARIHPTIPTSDAGESGTVGVIGRNLTADGPLRSTVTRLAEISPVVTQLPVAPPAGSPSLHPPCGGPCSPEGCRSSHCWVDGDWGV